MKKNKEYYDSLEILAKGLYNIAVRGGPIEDYHAEGCPIGDKEMEVINRFAFNRIGYMLDLLFSGEIDKFITLCRAESIFLSYFDPLDFDSDEVKRLELTLELLKEEEEEENL